MVLIVALRASINGRDLIGALAIANELESEVPLLLHFKLANGASNNGSDVTPVLSLGVNHEAQPNQLYLL